MDSKKVNGSGNGGNAANEWRVKVGLAEMLKGGVIMDVTNAEQAQIADAAVRTRSSRTRARTSAFFVRSEARGIASTDRPRRR